jgi:hypothetical protein
MSMAVREREETRHCLLRVPAVAAVGFLRKRSLFMKAAVQRLPRLSSRSLSWIFSCSGIISSP